DDHQHLSIAFLDLDGGCGCSSMPHDIRQGFLHDTIERYTDVQWPIREVSIVVQLDGHACMSGALRHQALYGHQTKTTFILVPRAHSMTHLTHPFACGFKQ